MIEMREDDREIYEILCSYLSVERQELFEKVLAERTRHICAVVEDIYQEHNAGAIMRSCDGFGVQDVHVVQNYNLLKVSGSISQGAQKWLSLNYYKESADCAEQLKASGYRVVASTPHRDAATLDNLDLSRPVALVLGGEKDGLSAAFMDMADDFVALGNVGFSESYNVSVAAALILSNLTQRLRATVPGFGLDEAEKEHLRVLWALKSIREGEKVLARHIGAQRTQEVMERLQVD
ncbi:MAG: RNA methyltransferase [Myxococcota bacterium]|jgi:tRNA (guanosine-2'-O-)-methyltransferase|nr:RNA methyltransferase [Myxococcota bacterium]